MSAPRHDTPPAVRYVLPTAVGEAGELSGRERALIALVNRRVVTAPTLDAVVEALFEDVAPAFACDRIGLAFLDEQGERLTSTHAIANYRPLRLKVGYTAELEGSSLQAVIERGVPRIIGDLEQYLAENPASGSSRLALAEGVRSSMTCPLEVDGRTVGVLFFSSQRKWAFGELEVRLFQAVTERLARVVARAWRARQVENSSRACFELLGFVAHELKGPVAGLASDARLLRSGYLGPVEPRQSEKLGGMVARAEHVLGLVSEYLDLARVERSDLPLGRVELHDVGAQVAQALEAVAPAVGEKRMRVVCDFPPQPVSLRADPSLLRVALVSLLSNAARTGYEGGEIRVGVAREGDDVVLRIRNEGPGFSAAERGRVLRGLTRPNLPALAREKGPGLGLYTAWRAVRLHGGRLTADSEEGRSAEFTVRLPASPASEAGPAAA